MGCMAATQPRSLVPQRGQALVPCGPGAPDEGEDCSRALQAIRELELRLGRFTAKSDDQLDAEMARGSDAVKADWIRERLVIAGEELEQAWVCSRQTLEQACERGNLFKLRISGTDWYPAAFATLSCVDVRAVCDSLRGQDPITAFIFWHAKHGSLRGMTLPEALRRGERQAVIHSSQTFASQYVDANLEPRSQDVETS